MDSGMSRSSGVAGAFATNECLESCGFCSENSFNEDVPTFLQNPSISVTHIAARKSLIIGQGQGISQKCQKIRSPLNPLWQYHTLPSPQSLIFLIRHCFRWLEV